MPRVFAEPRPITVHLLSRERKASLSATVALRHDCALRCPPSLIAPLSTKLASLVLLRHRTTGEKQPDSATVTPLLRPPSPHFATVHHNHHLATNVALLRRVSCASFTISSHRRTANSPRGKFKTRFFFRFGYFS